MHSSYSKVTMAWHGMTGWHNASSMTQHIIQSRPMFVYILPAAHSAKHVHDAGDTQCGMPGKVDGS